MSPSPKYRTYTLRCERTSSPAASSMLWNTKFNYRENKLIATKYVQHARLVYKCVRDFLSWLWVSSSTAEMLSQLWDVHTLLIINQTSFLQISQQCVYSFLFTISIRNVPNLSPSLSPLVTILRNLPVISLFLCYSDIMFTSQTK